MIQVDGDSIARGVGASTPANSWQGLVTTVNTAVDSTQAADDATKITWEFSSEVHRNHPFVSTMAAALGLTGQHLDDLFTLAASL